MNTTMLKKSTLAACLVGAILLPAAATSARAETAESVDRWHVNAALYFWYASIGGRASTGTGIDVDAGDIVDNLDGAFMGIIGARKGK